MHSPVVALLVAASLFPATGAAAVASSASALEEVVKDYQGDANINPCKHTLRTLREAQQETPDDIEQFAPDFPEALSNAIAAREQGACSAFDPVFKDYQRHREISPCRHTLRALRVALRQTPDGIEQVAPGFTKELRRAIKERRRDRCGHK